MGQKESTHIRFNYDDEESNDEADEDSVNEEIGDDKTNLAATVKDKRSGDKEGAVGYIAEVNMDENQNPAVTNRHQQRKRNPGKKRIRMRNWTQRVLMKSMVAHLQQFAASPTQRAERGPKAPFNRGRGRVRHRCRGWGEVRANEETRLSRKLPEERR